jgi:hypothetical protein
MRLSDLELQSASLRSADVEAPQPASRWLSLLAPSTSICALGVLGFAYSAFLLSGMGVSGEERDLALYIVGVLLLAPVCAAMQLFLVRPDFQSPRSDTVEAVNCWTAITALVALASIPFVMLVAGKAGDFWLQNAGRVVVAIAAMHVAGMTVVIPRARKHWPPIPAVLTSRAVQVTAFALAFFVASIALFWIGSSSPYLNLFVRLFVAPPFSSEPGSFGLGHALLLAAFGIAAVVALGKLEAALIRRGSNPLRVARTVALCVAILGVIIGFFDWSLNNDVFHYLTNVAPALHVLHGGTLMVDTFSQYGPGPVLVTLLGWQIGPATLNTAQLTVQFHNLMFYALWLICLYRMTRWKLAALVLGIFSIAFFFATWAGGYGNVNEAPSILALRHLPTLLMVLALSYLHPPRRHSAFTALATFISGIWSIETLIGTLGVHLAFLGLLGLRDRAVTRLVADGARAALPAVVAMIVITIATTQRAGAWPDYGTYLQFLSSYNLLAKYWSIAASPMFFGWMAMLLVTLLVWADAWSRVFGQRLTGANDAALFYRFVPMATLLMIQTAYFVGRSVDYTLVMAVLPFCAIAIPAVLGATAAVMGARGPAKLLAHIPVAIGLWVLTFTFLSLFRQNSPYSLLLHECRDLGRCSPAALARGLSETFHVRPVIERVRRPIADGWFDADGVVRDAVSMMTKWAPNEPAVTTLLGRLRVELMATELALMYAGKWNRWPRSFTLSDELVMPLAQRIVATPVRLLEGELVLVRRDETTLSFIEAGILKRIRAETTLCRIPDSSRVVVPYRVAGPSGCSSD